MHQLESERQALEKSVSAAAAEKDQLAITLTEAKAQVAAADGAAATAHTKLEASITQNLVRNLLALH